MKLHQIKANQTSIQHYNKHAKKIKIKQTNRNKTKHESEDLIKTEARKTWSDGVNFTLQNRFSCTFKVLKPMSFRGLRPLVPCQGLCPWTPPGALRQAPGPHPCWASRQAARGAGYVCTLFPILGIGGKWKCAPPPQLTTSCARHCAHAT